MQEVRDFCNEGSIHGVRLALKANTRTTRLFWSALVLLALALIISQVYQLFASYMSRPTAVKIDFLQDRTQRFRDITFCVLRRTNMTKLAEITNLANDRTALHAVADAIESIFQLWHRAIWDYPFESIKREKPLSNASEFWIDRINDMSKAEFASLVHNTTLQCEEMFPAMMQIGHSHLLDFCAHFRTTIASEGPCFVLAKPLYQYIPGLAGGLTVVHTYPHGHVRESLIHGQAALNLYTEVDGSFSQWDPTPVAIGSHSVIGMIDNHFVRASEAGASVKRWRQVVSTDNRTRCNCQCSCMNDKFLNICGCQAFNGLFHLLDDETVCGPRQTKDCLAIMANKSITTEQLISECISSCPVEGNIYRPMLQRSTVTFNPKRLMKSESTIITKNGTSVVTVYFSASFHKKVTQFHRITWNKFLSEIGGALGVWAGASLISVVHFLFLFFNFITRLGVIYGQIVAEKMRKKVGVGRKEGATVKELSVRDMHF